ncbi:MAG TPA: hypothetical protein VD735_03725 [Candidatus Saccharimonadales bacterium]|nr:hypothetical protein [Candidatus Saccharimonadales bacterium]
MSVNPDMLAPQAFEVAGPMQSAIAMHNTFRDAAAIPPGGDIAEGIKGQREMLWGTIGKMTAVAKPDERSVIQAWGELVDYTWFADSAATPPTGIRTYKGKAAIDRDIFPHTTLDALEARAKLAGMDTLITARKHNLNRNTDALEKPLLTAIHQTEPYKLLSGFALGAAASEKKLTSTQRMFKEQVITSQVAQDNAGVHPYVLRGLVGDATYGLDDETTKNRGNQDTTDPFVTARGQLYAMAESYLAASGFPAKVHYLTMNGDRQKSRLEINGASIENAYINQVFQPWFEGSTADHPNNLLAAGLVRGFIHALLTPANSGLSGEEAWSKLLAKSVEDVAIDHFFDIADATSIDNRSLNLQLARLKQPQAQTEQTYQSKLVVSNKERTHLTSAAEMRYDRERVVATVLKAPVGDPAGSRTMELLYPRVERPAPFNPEDAQLILQLKNENVFAIPGYELIGYNPDDQVLGYRYNAEADPYTPNLRPLDDNEQRIAIETADRAGLPDLAHKLGQNGLTVDGMLRLLQDQQYYKVPRDGERAPQIESPVQPEDIKRFLNPATGKLEVQCDSAGPICSLFLRETGIGLGGSHVGYVVDVAKGSVVDGQLHRQVPYIDAKTGKMHIADTTPPMDAATTQAVMSLRERTELLNRPGIFTRMVRALGSLTTRATQRLPRKATAPEAKPVKALPDLPAVTKDMRRDPIIKKETLANTRDGLVKQLGIALGSRDAALPPSMVYDSVRRRPGVDLMRLTLEIVEQTLPFQGVPAAKEQISHGRALYLLGYIDDLRNHPEKVRDPYNYATKGKLLATMEGALRNVAALTAPDTVA